MLLPEVHAPCEALVGRMGPRTIGCGPCRRARTLTCPEPTLEASPAALYVRLGPAMRAAAVWAWQARMRPRRWRVAIDRLQQAARRGLVALPVWAVLLGVGTLSHQPDYRTDFPGYARYVVTGRFLASHLVASILGAGIGVIGAAALAVVLLDRGSTSLASWALATFVMGNTCIAAVFGAAAFAQPAIGRAFLAGRPDAVAFNNDVYGAALFSVAGAGILLFSAGIIMLGVAVARSGTLPRWAGTALAVSGPLFAVGGVALPGFVQTLASVGLVAGSLAVALAGRAGLRAEPAAAPENA